MSDLDFTRAGRRIGGVACPGEAYFYTDNDVGTARVAVFRDLAIDVESYHRVVRAPLILTSGRLCIEEQEEPMPERVVLDPGFYEVLFCLRVEDEETEEVTLVFNSNKPPFTEVELLFDTL